MVDSHDVDTTYAGENWGGNAKWGIYKWGWGDTTGVNASAAQGITDLETFISDVRQITKSPTDPTRGRNEYERVAP